MPFRRINFFKGLFARADDWKAADRYHIERRKLHNTTLHVPGIIDGLDVTAAKEGRAVKVTAGHAISADGQEVWLERDTEVDVPFDDAGKKHYLILRNKDVEVDFRQDAANTEYSGNAFIEEQPLVEFVQTGPDQKSTILLAKIDLARGATKVIDGVPPKEPGPNEIDLRDRKHAGAVGGQTGIAVSSPDHFGKLRVNPSKGAGDADQEYKEGSWTGPSDVPAIYIAHVWPVSGQDGVVSWRMGVSRKGASIQYRLYVRNHGDDPVEVEWKVYRLG
jgi:hypothetical protein